MLFISREFLLFIPIVFLVYFIVPGKFRCLWLLITSIYFYMYFDPFYIFLILIPTLVSYLGAIFIEDNKDENKKVNNNKIAIFMCVFVSLLLLFVFKYTNFVIDSLNYVLAVINKYHHSFFIISNIDIALPIGISFYTFQTIGYLIDVYRGEIKAERNIIKYSVFVTFFPQLVAGPIERSKSLLKQISALDKVNLFEMDRVLSGVVTVLYGYFLKLVIADRAAVLVDKVFADYYLYGTIELFVAAVFFTIQIYADFGGYSAIAIGLAKILGINLMNNFNSPYFSISIKDFWGRWHISLSSWFKDYLYIPLGGNRKGNKRTLVNKMIVFFLSGLWHGANWTFIVWGGLHGLYQVIEDTLGKFIDAKILKGRVNTKCFSWNLLKILFTFFAVVFAWIFFRAENMTKALDYIYLMFIRVDVWRLFDGSVYHLGLDIIEMNIFCIAVAFLACIDFIQYRKKKSIYEFIAEQNLYFRWLVIIGMLFSVIVFGRYGDNFDSNSFIYFQF